MTQHRVWGRRRCRPGRPSTAEVVSAGLLACRPAPAGLGIAMGNAVPGVKAVALEVVGSNDEDGVAQALEQYVL